MPIVAFILGLLCPEVALLLRTQMASPMSFQGEAAESLLILESPVLCGRTLRPRGLSR